MKNIFTKLLKNINRIPVVMKIVNFFLPNPCQAIAGFEWHDENCHTYFQVRFERKPTKKMRRIIKM